MKIVFPLMSHIFYRTAFHPTELKIKEFHELKSGWHYGEGTEFDESALSDILNIHREIVLNGFFMTDAFPGLEGEIQITVYQGDDYLAFERSPNGSWSVTHEENDEEIESIQNLDSEKTIEFVKGLKQKLCNSSGYFPESIGIKQSKGSTTWLSSRMC